MYVPKHLLQITWDYLGGPSAIKCPCDGGKGTGLTKQQRHVKVEAKDSDATNPACQEGSPLLQETRNGSSPVPQRKCGLLITRFTLSETSLGNCISRTMRKEIPDV